MNNINIAGISIFYYFYNLQITTMVVNNVTVTTVKLIISPVLQEDESFYVCNVRGDTLMSTIVLLKVDLGMWFCDLFKYGSN